MTGRMFPGRFALTLIVFAAGGAAARAEPGDPPYQQKIERLSEIIGSVHYLRNLCGEKSDNWREKMDALLSAEKAEPERRARLVARFNRGYRSFAGSYENCTQAAITALSRYTQEGETLTGEIVTRFGN